MATDPPTMSRTRLRPVSARMPPQIIDTVHSSARTAKNTATPVTNRAPSSASPPPPQCRPAPPPAGERVAQGAAADAGDDEQEGDQDADRAPDEPEHRGGDH